MDSFMILAAETFVCVRLGGFRGSKDSRSMRELIWSSSRFCGVDLLSHARRSFTITDSGVLSTNGSAAACRRRYVSSDNAIETGTTVLLSSVIIIRYAIMAPVKPIRGAAWDL